MKKYKIKLDILIIAFLLQYGLQSCNRGCEKEYNLNRDGLFDNMPEGTSVIFESNTGKIDTLTYDTINHESNIDCTGRNCGRVCSLYTFSKQGIYFKNKFGMNRMYMFRYTTKDEYVGGKLEEMINVGIQIDTILTNYSYKEYKFNERFQSFNDVAKFHIINTSTNDTSGYFLYSKSKGILKINYRNTKHQDSLFTFKNII